MLTLRQMGGKKGVKQIFDWMEGREGEGMHDQRPESSKKS